MSTKTDVEETTLVLPVPPSPNRRSPHPMQRAKEKNTYRRKCWAAAIDQEKPPRHPPDRVVLTARFYLRNLRDEDNLAASLKDVLDCLKQEQDGKLHWRQGIADLCGWLVDDDPDHLHVASVEQEVDREEPRCEVTLRWREE